MSQSIGLFGAQAPLGRFLHSGDSPVFGGAFNSSELRNQRWILDRSDEGQLLFCHLLHSHCIWLLREWLANLEKIITVLLFLWLFFGDFYLEESHLCEVAVVIELVLDLARVVDERKIALQVFC